MPHQPQKSQSQDEFIEKCARIIAHEMTGGHPSRPKSIDYRAARAVIPAILEEAAKAIQCGCCDVCGEDPDYEYVCANELAARIRALGQGE